MNKDDNFFCPYCYNIFSLKRMIKLMKKCGFTTTELGEICNISEKEAIRRATRLSEVSLPRTVQETFDWLRKARVCGYKSKEELLTFLFKDLGLGYTDILQVLRLPISYYAEVRRQCIQLQSKKGK